VTRIASCQLHQLDEVASRSWLVFVVRGGPAPAALGDRAWLLCHCDDGVTWGRLDGEEWQLGSSCFPDLCPVPSESNVLEMRVFSPAAEVLIWRTENGLCGRMLRDAEPGDAGEQPDRPDDEERLLLASRVGEHREGFTRLGDGSGAEQALRLRVTEGPSSSWPRLRVRHYFARDDRTGCVRVVATRLVEVT
jgi:CRISPR-associated protein (TIGR03984 family)